MPVVLTVIVIVRLIVPPTVVNGGNTSSSAGWEMGRNAPVRGSRYPRTPGLAGVLGAWHQTVDAAMRQHMQTTNSFVNLIFVSLSEIRESVVLFGIGFPFLHCEFPKRY